MAHTADGQALICETLDGSTTPQIQVATAAQVASATTVPVVVKAATAVKAATQKSSSLAFTGGTVLPALALALLLLGVGTLLWGRVTQQGFVVAQDARNAEIRRRARQERDAANRDRWRW